MKDMSDFLRGQINMLESIMELKNIFDNYDNMKKELDDVAKKGAK